jgi:hypothetical protein
MREMIVAMSELTSRPGAADELMDHCMSAQLNIRTFAASLHPSKTTKLLGLCHEMEASATQVTKSASFDNCRLLRECLRDILVQCKHLQETDATSSNERHEATSRARALGIASARLTLYLREK